ncbi:MAG: aminopeptidase [Bacteroidales bacterium]|nr:aminopeptidase [Bacteroidales bacterium]
MKTKVILLVAAVAAVIFGIIGLKDKTDYAASTGVERTLAKHRKATLSNIRYSLSFNIPELLADDVSGSAIITFDYADAGEDLVLDFRPGGEALLYASANGNVLHNWDEGSAPEELCRNEHIVIPAEYLKEGENELVFNYIPENGSLNRSEEYLYTLLVPDRARTIFPCFDQPDLKARFTLQLEIPEPWIAVSNGELEVETVERDLRKQLKFKESDLISTYLFEFTAGLWKPYTFNRGELPMTIWYRETDPAKVAQLPEIRDQILFSLDFMEDYTGIPMPFSKYDCVLVPGFQFGGMEHPGAILYSASRLFLSENPSESSKLSRIDLIAHETAHLWFGDAVTMEWFDDVWTKEVFANYFAAMISRPLFPDIDYKLKDFNKFNLTAYTEDRTAGANPICQQLDNLNDSGLIYCNIIYNKAPVVMRMMADILGPEEFKAGLREYLNEFMYGNATWDALVEILDRHTDTDLVQWSHDWTKVAGMPEYEPEDGVLLLNLEADGYGYFRMTEKGINYALDSISTLEKPVERLSTLANLYENYLHGNVKPRAFANSLAAMLAEEKDQAVASLAVSYLSSLATRGSLSGTPEIEHVLAVVAANEEVPQQIRLSAFRSLRSIVRQDAIVQEMYRTWDEKTTFGSLKLSEGDYIALSYELAVRMPEKYDYIGSKQRGRIKGVDKLREFDYKYRAVHPSKAYRDSLFNSFLEPENRIQEPWTAVCLSYLNHPLRQEEALEYIRPALEALPDVQRTGDIFFPKNWISAVLRGHESEAAADILRDFLDDNADFKPLLKNKVLQAGDHLLRELP